MQWHTQAFSVTALFPTLSSTHPNFSLSIPVPSPRLIPFPLPTPPSPRYKYSS